MWDTVKIKNASYTVDKELIHVPTLNYIHVCLVNTNLGTPFISAIEFRPLNNETYVTQSGSLALLFRTDQGSLTDRAYRLVLLLVIYIESEFNKDVYFILGKIMHG